MKFEEFSKEVRAKWNTMVKAAPEIYRSNLSKEAIWETYLSSFPEGSNPIYIERTEHDCNCCKQFIRGIGNVVVPVNGKLDTIWNIPNLGSPYKEVAAALHEMVSLSGIDTIYRSSERSYGQAKTVQHTEKGTINWNHFSGDVTGKYFSNQVGKEQGQHLTNVGVFKRGLTELYPEAVDTVLDLIHDNNLYRGQENLSSLAEFAAHMSEYRKLSPDQRIIFLHQKVNTRSALIRNTALGTLLIDLSGGVPLEQAVASYENKVSGTNYKRPKALVTTGMIKAANETVMKLGLVPSLSRRHAVISDVAITDVVWADRAAQAVMKPSEGIMGILGETVKAGKPDPNGVKLSIQEFLATVVPEALSMDLLLESDLVPKLVSITAPVEEDAPSLFKWNNGFGWSYNGNVTDSSITERVKAAGGATDGLLRVSLSWDNKDDLDLHCRGPRNSHIYFGNKQGILDVDANGQDGMRDDPVENMNFKVLPDGQYTFSVNQFSRRTTTNQGFTLEVACEGQVHHFHHKTNINLTTMAINVKNGKVESIHSHKQLTSSTASMNVWGLSTKTYVPVQTIMKSPNHWGGNQEGNEHTFFLLEGCVNPEVVRGFYNEFLRNDLHEHRKVFEVLGNKMLVQPTEDQLSGVGFSSTIPAEFQVRVTTDKGQRIYIVKV